VYRNILNKIRENDYDVFSQRARVSRFAKLRLLPRLWVDHKLGLGMQR
jgi:phytoene/squalene synthetase